jgi:Uma2 family endonuclease
MASVAETCMTVEGLMELADQPGKRELVNGEIIEMGASKPRQGRIASRIGARLTQWAEATGLGEVYTETMFEIGENVRIPDVAVVAAERIPDEGEPDGPWPFAPDVAIEVISPSNDYEDLMAKTIEYLEAGARQVWLVSPTAQTVTIYRSLTDIRAFGPGDEIDGGEALPGFRCPVAELFTLSIRRTHSS